MAIVTQKLASSSGLEQDARRVTMGHTISPSEIAIGVIIGRTSEAFNLFVFAIACVLVFPKVVFPFASPFVGTLYSFMVFAISFMARPVGSLVFMAIDRRHGRGTKLTIALILLGGSTASIAFLPGYNEIGYLSILGLMLFRAGQGFALGGAWDGLASLLALNAPENRRGLFAMIPQLGSPFGYAVASALFAYFLLNVSQQEFIEWGWRYPFFVAFVINVVALFARLRLIATKEFADLYDSQALVPVPVLPLLRAHWRTVLVGAFVPLATYALYYIVSIYSLWFVDTVQHGSIGNFLLLQCGGAGLQTVATVMSGLLADRIGRRTLLGACAIAVGVLAVLTPLLLGGGIVGQVVFALAGCTLLGLSFGQAAGAVASHFGGSDRYTGSALTSDLAWLVGAGFAPLVAIASYDVLGFWGVCIYLLSGVGCTLVALGFNKRLAIPSG